MEVFLSPKGCLEAIGDFDLFVYVVEMALDRMTANKKVFTYFCVYAKLELEYPVL